MAGLECAECSEPTRVVGSGEVFSDTNGKPAFKRNRRCVNPQCRLYMLRLLTVEVYATASIEGQEAVPLLEPLAPPTRRTSGKASRLERN